MPTIRINDFSVGLVTEADESRIPPGAASDIRNFRVDKLGQLRAVTGPVVAFTAPTAGASDQVRRVFSWTNPADDIRWVLAAIGRGIYSFVGAYKNGSQLTSQLAGLADDAGDPRNVPFFTAWRSKVLMSSMVDTLKVFDGFAWTDVVMQNGTDPDKAYLADTPKGVGLEVLNERLYIADGSRVWYTDIGYYDVIATTNFFWVRENDGFDLATQKAFKGDLILFKPKYTEILVGGPAEDGGMKRTLFAEIGCLAAKSLVDTGEHLIWLSHEGVMRYGADGLTKLSRPIQSYFTSAYSQSALLSESWDDSTLRDDAAVVGDDTLILGNETLSGAVYINTVLDTQGLQRSILEYASATYFDGRYYLSIPVASGGATTFVFSENQMDGNASWVIYEGEGMGGSSLFTLAGSTDPKFIFAGAKDKPEIVAIDAGSELTATATYTKAEIDGDGPEEQLIKEYRRIRISFVIDDTTVSEFTANYTVHPGKPGAILKTGSVTFRPNLAITGEQVIEKSLPVNAIGRAMDIELVSTGSIIIKSIEVDWLPRRVR